MANDSWSWLWWSMVVGDVQWRPIVMISDSPNPTLAIHGLIDEGSSIIIKKQPNQQWLVVLDCLFMMVVFEMNDDWWWQMQLNTANVNVLNCIVISLVEFHIDVRTWTWHDMAVSIDVGMIASWVPSTTGGTSENWRINLTVWKTKLEVKIHQF